MFSKLKTATRLYLTHWKTWLGVGLLYAGVYYTFYFLGGVVEARVPVLSWPLLALQVLVYIYLLIGVTRLALSMLEQDRQGQKNAYVQFKTLFTPLDRVAEPFFLMLSIYGLIVLALQISLQPDFGPELVWLSVLVGLLAYSLVFLVLFLTQFALPANLYEDKTITEAYGKSLVEAVYRFFSTVLVDIVILMVLFVGYVSQVLLFVAVPFGVLLLSTHYLRSVAPAQGSQTASS